MPHTFMNFELSTVTTDDRSYVSVILVNDANSPVSGLVDASVKLSYWSDIGPTAPVSIGAARFNLLEMDATNHPGWYIIEVQESFAWAVGAIQAAWTVSPAVAGTFVAVTANLRVHEYHWIQFTQQFRNLFDRMSRWLRQQGA